MNRGSGYCWWVCRVSVFKPWLPSAAGGCQQPESTEVESRIVSTIRFVLPFHRNPTAGLGSTRYYESPATGTI
jgi:hypothetical protein